MHLKPVKENKRDRRRASRTQEICPSLLFQYFLYFKKVRTSSQTVGDTTLSLYVQQLNHTTIQ
jgi:hypothetical protein